MNKLSVKESGQRGQSLAETAIVFPLFIFLVCALFDYGHVLFIQLTMQHALREAGRYAVTGQHLPDPNRIGQPLSRPNSIYQIAQRATAGLPLSGYQISSQTGGTGSAGGPGDLVTLSILYDVQLITPFAASFWKPNGIYRCTASTTFKNEPFPLNQTN